MLEKSTEFKNLFRCFYSSDVLDHFNNPRNVGSFDKKASDVGTALVGAPACGDVIKLQIKVKDNKIEDAKFKTFGCGSALATSSLATEMIRGLSLEDALKVKNDELAKKLKLPPIKLHCSMLAEEAIEAAIKDYRNKLAESNI